MGPWPYSGSAARRRYTDGSRGRWVNRFALRSPGVVPSARAGPCHAVLCPLPPTTPQVAALARAMGGLLLALAILMPGAAGGGDARYPAVQPGAALVFPRDHGAHPSYRTEWWYITGWVHDSRGRD